MDIQIPKVVRTVDLSGYAEELRGQFLHIWVNPPLGILREYSELAEMLKGDAAVVDVKAINERLNNWYCVLWSQGPEPTHWTVAELHELEEKDPAFLEWMINETWNARREHVDRKKK